MEQKLGSTSHKREKIKSHNVDFKLEAIVFAKSCDNKAAERKFNVAPKTIRDWIRKEEQLRLMKQNNAYGGKRLRLEGVSRSCVGSLPFIYHFIGMNEWSLNFIEVWKS